jgi:hypothetical protein
LEEQVEEDLMKENVFHQNILEPQFTTQLPINDDISEPNQEELPKPAARYGHAACKYEGNFFSIIKV